MGKNFGSRYCLLFRDLLFQSMHEFNLRQRTLQIVDSPKRNTERRFIVFFTIQKLLDFAYFVIQKQVL